VRISRIFFLPALLMTAALEAQEHAIPVMDQEFYLQQADAALREGRVTQAGQMIAWLEQYGDRVSGDDVALLKAEHAIAGTDVATAAAALSAIKDAERNICRFEPARAWVAANHEAFDDAIVALGKAVRLCPDDAGIWNLLGLVFVRKGEAKAAGAAFGRALTLAPDQAEVRNNYALALLQQGELALASRQLEAAVGSAPGNPLISANMDFVSGMKGDVPSRNAQDDDAQWSTRLINFAKGANAAAKTPRAYALFSQAVLTLDHFDEELWTAMTTSKDGAP
jgi:Flp pilus assembly protein TadD